MENLDLMTRNAIDAAECVVGDLAVAVAATDVPGLVRDRTVEVTEVLAAVALVGTETLGEINDRLF